MKAAAALNFGSLRTRGTSETCAGNWDIKPHNRMNATALQGRSMTAPLRWFEPNGRKPLAVLVNNLASDNCCDRFAFHLASVERGIPAARPRLRHIELPDAIQINQCEIGVAALEQTPWLHFHDLLWIKREQLGQAPGF